MRFDVRLSGACVVHDANGTFIPTAVRGDTESGLVQCVVVDEAGNWLSNPDGTIKLITARYPAPLRCRPLARTPRHLTRRTAARPVEPHPDKPLLRTRETLRYLQKHGLV